MPVILLHGVLAKADNMDELASMITSAHPGTQIYNIRGYGNLDSMEKMWTQVNGFRKKMLPIFENSTDGVNMLCYSQGNDYGIDMVLTKVLLAAKVGGFIVITRWVHYVHSETCNGV